MSTPLIDIAKENYEQSAKRLCEVVAEEYPIGSRLYVELGGNDLIIEVTGHNQFWWSEPGEIQGRNINTGKVRKFMPSNVIKRLVN